MFKLFSNAILCGDIDYYCLMCDYQMTSFVAAEAHIEEESHKKKLTPFVSSFPGEQIRKFDKGYYCTFCNVIIATNNDIELHVLDLKHVQKKGSFVLRRIKDKVIVLNGYVISDNVWNGIMYQRCLVCNIDFEKDVHHKLEVSHILNLIQKKVQFTVNNTVYRKIGNNSIHCLTCNAVIEMQAFKKHFNQDHKLKPKNDETKVTADTYTNTKLLNHVLSKKEDGDTINVKVNNVREVVNLKSPETVLKKDANETVTSNTNQQAVIINMATSNLANDEEKTKKSKSLALVPLEENTVSDNLPKEIKDKTTDSQKIRNPLDVLAEAKAFANENELTYNGGIENAYCRVCEKSFSSSLKNMKEHVAGKPHKSMINKSNIKKSNTDKIRSSNRTATYGSIKIHQIEVTEHELSKKTFLNEVLCLDSISFNMICKIDDLKYRCQACEENLKKSKIDMHSESISHIRNIKRIRIVSNLFPSEFFREVRRNIYHCGFCNQLESFDKLEDHIKCDVHKNLKQLNEECLITHRPFLRLFKFMCGSSDYYYRRPSLFDILMLSGLMRNS